MAHFGTPIWRGLGASWDPPYQIAFVWEDIGEMWVTPSSGPSKRGPKRGPKRGHFRGVQIWGPKGGHFRTPIWRGHETLETL